MRTAIGKVAGAHIDAEQRVVRAGALLATVGLRLGCIGRKRPRGAAAGAAASRALRIGIGGSRVTREGPWNPTLSAPLRSAASAVAEDFSLWGLFLQADVIVKAVIVVLLIASVWSWAIIFDKSLRYGRARRLAVEFEQAFWSGGSLDQLYDDLATEAQPPDDGVVRLCNGRVAPLLRAVARTSRRTGWKASSAVSPTPWMRRSTASSTSSNVISAFSPRWARLRPFVGLFGTVWGIMNSFQSIAASKDTSLAVVAPGIAEALFATALGLVAAIPAVVAYNKLSSDLDRYAGRLEAFGTEFRALLGRQLEERAV